MLATRRQVIAGAVGGLGLLGIPAARRAVASTPVAEDVGCFAMQTYRVPKRDHPHDVAPDPDGRYVWYSGQASGIAGILDRQIDQVKMIPLEEGAAPHGVIVGPDRAAWLTDGGLNAIVRVDATTFEVTTYPLRGPNANLNTATFDLEGTLWFTGQNGIVGRLDPSTGEIVTQEAPRGRGPYGITTTPEGDVWFASLAGSYIGRLSFSAGTIAVEVVEPPTAGAGCRRVWSDSQGRLWVSEWNAGQVAVYDPQSKAWQEWRLPGEHPQAYAVYVDEHDAVWLSDFGANALVRFEPESEHFDVLPLPHPDAAVRQLAGRPGEVWGAESGAAALVVVQTECPS
jgi:virginiamycin B lyase